MRCKSCNIPLTPFERTRKTQDNDYLDLCNHCFDPISEHVEVIERFDLLGNMDVESE